MEEDMGYQEKEKKENSKEKPSENCGLKHMISAEKGLMNLQTS